MWCLHGAMVNFFCLVPAYVQGGANMCIGYRIWYEEDEMTRGIAGHNHTPHTIPPHTWDSRPQSHPSHHPPHTWDITPSPTHMGQQATITPHPLLHLCIAPCAGLSSFREPASSTSPDLIDARSSPLMRALGIVFPKTFLRIRVRVRVGLELGLSFSSFTAGY